MTMIIIILTQITCILVLDVCTIHNAAAAVILHRECGRELCLYPSIGDTGVHHCSTAGDSGDSHLCPLEEDQ